MNGDAMTSPARSPNPFNPVWVAGFMSGTSLDAVDAAIVLTNGHTVTDLGPATERRYTPEERAILQQATDAARQWNWIGPEPRACFDAAMAVITDTHEQTWRQLLERWEGPVPELVGVHGQTVLHRRTLPSQPGATRQLLDAASLQARLGVTLAYDFRSADISAGGQGAPLAPAYHGALLAALGDRPNAALNLGGVANITLRLPDGSLIAFDTGPANGPLDEWVEAHGHGTYDVDGRIAQTGRVDQQRLQALLDHPYLRQAWPKSLDRYDFNRSMVAGLGFADGAATLTAFTAATVAAALAQLPQMPDHLIVCGGGRRNPTLMSMLQTAMPRTIVMSAEQAGWRGDSIEAEAFALLAVRTQRGLPISWPHTTGVPVPTPGGRLLAAPATTRTDASPARRLDDKA